MRTSSRQPWLPVLLGVPVIMASGCFGQKFEPLGPGEECVQIEECSQGLICAHDGTCRFEGDIGTVPLGGACAASANCRVGLVCSREGTCANPGDPGTTPFGEACDNDDACQLGLSCAEDGTCRGFQVPFWPGDACPDPDQDATPFRVLWEVPDGETPPTFYGHPFPEDSRVSGGTIDLSGHPTPGPLIELLGDVPRAIADEVGANLGGTFGPNQAIFVRMSTYPDSGTLSFGIPGASDGTLAIVDLTDEAAFDRIHPFGYEINSARTAYICHNWLAAYPIDGRPFLPGHTYALLLGSDIRSDDDGSTLAQTADFAAMLGDAAPADARLAEAWAAYQPLRDWLVRAGVSGSALGGAAVFTVQDVEARPQAVYDAVQAATLPTLAGAIDCADGADPFAVAGDDLRGCSATDPAFAELQGTLGLPQFQAGTPPFKTLEDGGRIEVAGGLATVQRTEDVVVTLTIPEGDAPVDGWPLVIYGHGTGGAYTSAVRTGIAKTLSAVAYGAETVKFATLGFDAPMHGPRAAPANHEQAWLDVDPNAYDPDVLFFNPLNPAAARDNVLQQSGDLWTLSRWAAEVGVAAADSPTGEAIDFDETNLYYLGHSQGGVVGTMFAAYDTNMRAVVLSGAGGLTIQSLLNKTSPNDIPAAIRVALADPDISRIHPVLNLAQALADGADGVNFARRVLREPFTDTPRKHTFMISGVGDTYSPDETQYPLARALGVDQIINGNPPFDTIDIIEPPVSENASGLTTGVVGLYQNAGDDAHFVLFDREDARDTMAAFLASAVVDDAPTVE